MNSISTYYFNIKKIIAFSFLLLAFCSSDAQKIIVDASGNGNFKTIQQAINSLPDSATKPRILFIKKGIYNEKIFIEKHNIVLEGEDKNAVVLTYSIARDEWRCEHADDWGVATLNLRGNDITLKNLTLQNSFGFDHSGEITVPCAADSSHKKNIRRDGHQMALRSFQTTRLKVINCVLKAFGGDTVSPWNTDDGMFYFKDCEMWGGVDFYCPRGWAWAENCTFFATTGPASIWHDGSKHEDSKTILKNCSFKGYDGFMLGRYHRDAQFYLIDCLFADNMADKPIYRVSTTNVIQWGERIYYSNCHRKAGDYSWFKNNLETAKGKPSHDQITTSWLFGNRWNPLLNE
ncbi:MAG: pectinesterase [Sphingobacteriia bacterium]|nr:pectinesterase [Sphingobacteriia bacterium]